MVFNFRLNPRHIHKRSVSFHKFDLPVYLGKGNHDPELLPKIHLLQLIAFDFLNLISFVDVVLLSAAVLKSSPEHITRSLPIIETTGLRGDHCLNTNLYDNKNILLCFCHFCSVAGNKPVCFAYSVNQSHVP